MLDVCEEHDKCVVVHDSRDRCPVCELVEEKNALESELADSESEKVDLGIRVQELIEQQPVNLEE